MPKLDSKRLLNDLQITVAETPDLGNGMTIGLVVRYGSTFDPANKGGLAYLVSRMFMKATVDKKLQDIQDELKYLGASIEVMCDWDGIRFLLRADSSACERSLLLLYQIVGEAEFDEESFKAEKQSILQAVQKSTDPRRRIHQQFENVLFSGTTYGRPLMGTPASLSAIKLGDVRYFYRKFFSPGQTSLQIVGNVQSRAVLRIASRIWGVWIRKDDVPFTFNQPRQPAGRQIYVDDDPNSPASQFIIGGLFPRREDPAYINVLFASHILQERLTRLLPTSLLTVGSEGRRLVSPFYIQGQAAAEQTVDQIQKIQQVIEEMKSNPVSNEEMEAARKEMLEGYTSSFTSTDGLCNFLLDAELYRLGSNYSTLVMTQIRRCSVDMVKQATNDWILPGGEVILIRGPLSTLKPILGPLGPYRRLSY